MFPSLSRTRPSKNAIFGPNSLPGFWTRLFCLKVPIPARFWAPMRRPKKWAKPIDRFGQPSRAPTTSPNSPSRFPAVPRPPNRQTHEFSASPILSGLSRARIAAPRLAARRFRRPLRHAGGAAGAASGQRPPAEAGQRRVGAAAGENSVWISLMLTDFVVNVSGLP